MRCGLLGKKLGHSYSPQIHGYLGSYSYDLFEIQPEKLESFLKNSDFTGLNVTIPYKKEVLPFCDELSDVAAELGAVNTIVRRPNNTLIGHNTDYFGFQSMLHRSGIQVSGKKVLVLGSGGASATVVSVLRKHNANVIVISRSGNDNYGNLHRHTDAAVIVNTTPVGMYPEVGKSAIDIHLFPSLVGVLDVVYNPSRTQLLLDAEKKGLITENGLWMLIAQAKESAEWFTGCKISDDEISVIYSKLSRQMENIVLIGMPGCGKSTIGKLIANQLNRRFVDIDTEIEAESEMTIPDIFEKYGENTFRQLETKCIAKYGKESGLVIATGGGAVTRSENYPHLHQNGRIIWIKRDISCLPADGRPISMQNRLSELYAIRKPMYEAFSDSQIDNQDAADNTAALLLQSGGYL